MMFGNAIKTARKQRKLTQDQVAQCLSIARPSYTQIETGKRKLSAEEALTLCRLFNCSFEELVKEKVQPLDKRIDRFLNVLWSLKTVDKFYFKEYGKDLLLEFINRKK